MDYNIKVKYDGAGKQFASARQRVIQAQKAAEKKGTTTPIGANRDLINSIQKLIDSNKKLERAILKISGTGLGGTRGGGGGAPLSQGTGSGIGRIGAAIPLGFGAGVAAMGFAIQKINQVGNAYIQLASQQLGSVGLGGFRRGRGVYGSAEMGAGMAAYAKSLGRFATGTHEKTIKVKNKKGKLVNKKVTRFDINPDEVAEQVGAIYGLSSAEAFGQVGTFQRAGANYQKVAKVAAGTGVQSELPVLLSGLSNILEEAIRSGLDTSEMSKDIEEGFLKLAQATPAKSLEAAMSITRKFSGVQKNVAAGKLTTMEEMYGAQASRDLLMERLKTPEYRNRLAGTGVIDEETKRKIADVVNKGGDFTKLQQTIGADGTQYLLQDLAQKTGPQEFQRRTFQKMRGDWGGRTKDKFAAYMAYKNMGGVLDVNEFTSQWEAAGDFLPLQTTPVKTKKGKLAKSPEEAGGILLAKRQAAVAGGPAGKSRFQQNRREDLLLDYGAAFARASREIEGQLMNLARDVLPYFGQALNKITEEIQKGFPTFKTSTKYGLKETVRQIPIIGGFAESALDYIYNRK